MEKTHIGIKIKAIRRIKGFTQEDLAEKINKTRALIAHIEQTGKSSHYTLKSILAALNVSDEYFEGFNEQQILANESKAIYGKNLAAVKEKLENCQKENEILRELVESQKKMLFILEKKKRR